MFMTGHHHNHCYQMIILVLPLLMLTAATRQQVTWSSQTRFQGVMQPRTEQHTATRPCFCSITRRRPQPSRKVPEPVCFCIRFSTLGAGPSLCDLRSGAGGQGLALVLRMSAWIQPVFYLPTKETLLRSSSWSGRHLEVCGGCRVVVLCGQLCTFRRHLLASLLSLPRRMYV